MNEEEYWEIPDGLDCDGFDFNWRPELFEPPFIHQFPDQHCRGGGPRFVVSGATEIKYEDSQRAIKLADMSKWDVPSYIGSDGFDWSWYPNEHEPPFIHQFPDQWSQDGGPRWIGATGATEIKYHSTPIATALPDWSKWQIPDGIDTSNFDFAWYPPQTNRPLNYQFGTQHQKTGGPLYIQQGARRTKYMDTQRVIALPHHNWQIDSDADVDGFDWSWHPDATDTVLNYAFGNGQIPAINKSIVYKTIDVAPYKFLDTDAQIKYRPLDIIFLSNGETGEEARYNRLCEVAGREVRWIRGINGREAAIRHAAETSTTKWFILFPAKIWASDKFDYDFQPNRSYDPKHYIFYSTNPLNGLEYGHQAAVCYNRELVLDTIEYGLDFTMSKLHDIVPISCGIAQYNSDVTMTWRTAFREVIKLRAAGDQESIERLNTWLTCAKGQHARWSIRGAQDGIEYYDSVGGDHEQLMKTFSWLWLSNYFKMRYHEINTEDT